MKSAWASALRQEVTFVNGGRSGTDETIARAADSPDRHSEVVRQRGRRHHSALRAAELARLFASVLLSRGTREVEKSSDRANFRQIQFKE
jgi:hypothetical protein